MTGWDCDFLACSAYKFFGPHVGILYGKRHLMESLPAYKLRPAPDTLPDRWMTGTQNHEGLAGVPAAVDYLADLGTGATRRERLRTALEAIRTYERQLARTLLAGLAERPRFRVLGITRPGALDRDAVSAADLIVLDHPGRLSNESVKLMAALLRWRRSEHPAPW